MTPEYLCSATVTERDKTIACKSAFHALKRPIHWPELLGHLQYLRHAIVRWGSCDASDSRIRTFLRHDDTRILASTFSPAYAVAVSLHPYARLVPPHGTIDVEPYPLGRALHMHCTTLTACVGELATVDAMGIDPFSKTLWKDTIRSNFSFIETMGATDAALAVLASRCSKMLVYTTVMFKEAQKYAACEDTSDARTCVDWARRMCGVLDGIVAAARVEPCPGVEVDEITSYLETVGGIHNAIRTLYAPLQIYECPTNSPLELPCKSMMHYYDIVTNLSRLHPTEV